jgi:hypothetical protein
MKYVLYCLVLALTCLNLEAQSSAKGVNLPSVVAGYLNTGQTAALSATTIYTPSATGLFRVCYQSWTTTTGSAGTQTIQVLYSNEVSTGISLSLGAAQSMTSAFGSGQSTFCDTIHAKTGTAIQIGSTVGTTWTGSPVWSIQATVEQLQ